MTMRTSAHLASALDDRFHSLEKRRGSEVAQIAYESHADAISRIESIVRTEEIDCGFRRVDGYLFAHKDGLENELEVEHSAAVRAGLEDAELLDSVPVPGATIRPGIRFPRQAEFHPMRYLQGLAEAFVRKGGVLRLGTRIDEIDGDRYHAFTSRGEEIRADHFIVATNSPFNDRVVIHTKQAPYMSYVIALRIPAGSVPHALYWDTEDPYHYVRVAADESGAVLGEGKSRYELLIVGGEDHKTGQADDAAERYARLEDWARRHFPMCLDVVESWCGQVIETLDGLAHIGRNPMDALNVYVVTGDSGMGLTHGTLAGVLLTDLIQGRENPWQAAYEPDRLPVGGLGDFLSENLNVAAQYMDWMKGGDVSDASKIAPGSGAVLRRGASFVAAYRDEDGKLSERSAVCPHLAGIVSWNSDDRTWDCPCHGSRFDAHGRVIQGPANGDLAPIERREPRNAPGHPEAETGFQL